MRDFSIYDYALEAAGAETEDFGTVAHISRREYAERQTFAFRAAVPVLEYISLLIENALLLRTHRGGRLYVGFEKLSRMEGIVDRYMRIADVSERVYVFGEQDWQPPRHPNLRVVALDSGVRLTREWFVIADSPSMRVALVGYDESSCDDPAGDGRTFRALKTTDAAIVRRLTDAAEHLIDDIIAS